MKSRYLPIIGITSAILFWYAIVHMKLINPVFAEPPEIVFPALFSLFYHGNLISDLAMTLFRMASGFTIGACICIPVGLVMGYSRRIYGMFSPVFDFMRSTPPTALISLFMLFFGIADESKIAVVAFGSGMLILLNVMYGVHQSGISRTMYAKTLHSTSFQIFTKITFFEALPQTFVGLRQGLSVSLILIIVVEMIVGSNLGLGERIQNAQLSYRLPEMYAIILLTGIIGFLSNFGLVRLEKKIVHWVGKT